MRRPPPLLEVPPQSVQTAARADLVLAIRASVDPMESQARPGCAGVRSHPSPCTSARGISDSPKNQVHSLSPLPSVCRNRIAKPFTLPLRIATPGSRVETLVIQPQTLHASKRSFHGVAGVPGTVLPDQVRRICSTHHCIASKNCVSAVRSLSTTASNDGRFVTASGANCHARNGVQSSRKLSAFGVWIMLRAASWPALFTI